MTQKNKLLQSENDGNIDMSGNEQVGEFVGGR
jgi:hypothetical protein